ncbi:hypothetical protein F8388_002148 [Cannabis sativa]|uniref:DYW domain-containing protein n=1 Tax=Cannabis sativa TaxID=3483 RepID=A0A7J6H3S7_CANSA|nr:hypothetical protein F8388_002148 [Cannabis sativa]KAF4389877.1 hypothetical protein G4B88_024158 [Cannabis sativa]
MLNVGIRSELDHYACVVDLLGCAGWLEEAEHLIISMPIIPDIAIWDALHGACRVHANAEMGRTVGNLLIQSDKIHDGRNINRMRRQRISTMCGMKLLRKFSYIAKTKGVVFDIEALAFGLMYTEPGSLIRIVKNIRICNDCHSTIKLVSKVFKRKIVVCDCYHHLENGQCSCMDYW